MAAFSIARNLSKKKAFACVILCMIFIHYSSIIVLPFIWLYDKRPNLKQTIAILGISLVAGLIGSIVFKKILIATGYIVFLRYIDTANLGLLNPVLIFQLGICFLFCYFEPILKDGRTIEEVRAENKKKENTQNIINEFHKLLRNEDIRGIRKMLRRNELLNDLNTRELNEDFPIDQYKFVKRNGKLTFIHDFNYHPVVDNEINDNIDLKNEINKVSDSKAEFEKLKIKVDNIYEFCHQVQEYIINLESRIS